MVFEVSKYMVGREVKEIKISLKDDSFVLKVREIPGSLLNQFVYTNLGWDSGGNSKFNFDGYYRDCLKYMIVEAPWGETNDVFLTQINSELMSALAQITPKAFTASNVSVGEIKKGS